MEKYPQFRNDYSVLCCDEVLAAIQKYHLEINDPYGDDYHTKNAVKLIKDFFEVPDSSVYLLPGGTITNLTLIAHALKSYEAVIACDSGHINVHETGAIEQTGHKIIPVTGIDGKLTVDLVDEAVKKHVDCHMVKPKLVYISDTTEIGTIYHKDELIALHDYCRKNHLYLFIDGARLASALTSPYNDIKPSELSHLCDAFYLGGTKNGLMNGEALVINNDELKGDFAYQIKSRGAMSAKSMLLGIQFERLLEDNLFLKLSASANIQALALKKGLEALHYHVLPSESNQVFVEMKNDKALDIMEKFGCEIWSDLGETILIRFVTSFITTEDDIKTVLDYLK